MHPSSVEIAANFAASLERAARFDEPFRHFFARELFPAGVADDLACLPIAPPCLEGRSGRREYHNDARCFFNAATMRQFPVFDLVGRALQSSRVVEAIESLCGASLAGTFLRIEYAVDCEGFWLEAHTDLGVKKFTCLISLAETVEQSSLGTDIYTSDKRLYRRFPFLRNAALIFVPAGNTWHGFAERPIDGLRRSLILNYVAPEWQDREQLAFPADPVQSARCMD